MPPGEPTQQPAPLDTGYQVTDEQLVQLSVRGWTSLPGLLNEELARAIQQHLAAGEAHDSYSGPSLGLKSTNRKYQNVAWQDPFLRLRAAGDPRSPGSPDRAGDEQDAPLESC